MSEQHATLGKDELRYHTIKSPVFLQELFDSTIIRDRVTSQAIAYCENPNQAERIASILNVLFELIRGESYFGKPVPSETDALVRTMQARIESFVTTFAPSSMTPEEQRLDTRQKRIGYTVGLRDALNILRDVYAGYKVE